jgi:hypothetical protein
MSCVFNRTGKPCGGNTDPDCVRWEVGQGFCKEHVKYVRDRMTSRVWNIEGQFADDYTEDYVKLMALMFDRKFCQTQLFRLNAEMRGGAREKGADKLDDLRYRKASEGPGPSRANFVRLSKALEYYEGLCYFPTTHRLYTANLSSENYTASIALGYMPKDSGAGAKHGEYSHRLQWHIVMRVVTDGFTVSFKRDVWKHSPLDLFTSLASATSWGNGIWGAIFDSQDGWEYNNPAVLNQDISGTFQWKNTMVDEGLRWNSDIDLLHSSAVRRTDKRSALVDKGKELAKRIWPIRNECPLGDLDYEVAMVGLVQRWRNTGGPPADGKPTTIYQFTGNDAERNETMDNAVNRLARAVWKSLSLTPKKNLRYQIDETENAALLLRGDTLMTHESIKERIAYSNIRLNRAAYSYVPELGAYPKKYGLERGLIDL